MVREKKQFTSNSVLNNLLNETANEEWETLGGRTFDSSQINSVLKNQYANLMNGNNQPTIPGEGIEGEPATNISDTLMNNLTKDYRSTLSAMKKSAESRRSV